MTGKGKVVERLGRVSYYFKSLLAVGWQGDADIYREHTESVNMAIALLKEQPDIVRCGECKYYREGFCYNPNAYETTGGNTVPDWFCADGRRRPEVGPNEVEPVSEFEESEKGISFRWRCGECGQELRKDTDLFCPHCGRRVMWSLLEA